MVPIMPAIGYSYPNAVSARGKASWSRKGRLSCGRSAPALRYRALLE
jgi:hypothetical protein